MKNLGFYVFVAVLAGCSSEVDKCLSAEMKAWRATNDESRRYNKQNEQYNREVDVYNEEVKRHNAEINARVASQSKNSSDEATGKRSRDGYPIFDLRGSHVSLGHKDFKENKSKPVDERPVEIVEAELRRICMRLK
jgi:hypothetical protein